MSKPEIRIGDLIEVQSNGPHEVIDIRAEPDGRATLYIAPDGNKEKAYWWQIMQPATFAYWKMLEPRG